MRLAAALVACFFALSACSGPLLDEEHGVGGTSSGGGSGPSAGVGGSGTVTGGGGTSGTGGVPVGGAATTGGASTGGTPMTGGASTGGSPTTGGASTTGGAAGTGACVENLACELDPPPSTGDVHQDCVNRINQFRGQCACLPPLERWTEGEACADQMAEYDSVADTAHEGFSDEICNGGFGQNECPGWRSETQVIDGCLQSMWDEGPPPSGTCNNACFQMYGHFINMTNPDHTRVACGFYTTPGGEVWAVQNFTD